VSRAINTIAVVGAESSPVSCSWSQKGKQTQFHRNPRKIVSKALVETSTLVRKGYDRN
jgi:hypothetical protein